jgi:hypothetical protein
MASNLSFEMQKRRLAGSAAGRAICGWTPESQAKAGISAWVK